MIPQYQVTHLVPRSCFYWHAPEKETRFIGEMADSTTKKNER